MLITQGRHYNKLAILLAASTATHKESTYKVLVLDNQLSPEEEFKMQNADDSWHKMLSLSHKYREFVPEMSNRHTMLTIKSSNVVQVTKHIIKCEADKIIQNWEQRQIPRFKDSPPGQSVIKALDELFEFTKSFLDRKIQLEFIPLTSQSLELNQDAQKMREFYENVLSVRHVTNIPSFDADFKMVYDRKILEEKKELLQHEISYKNLSLYPDYCNKLEVLKELKYIDDSLQVSMKGRVACEMGQNELLITELVLRNILTNLEPVEIAALLSGLVFQAKTDVEPNIPDKLKKMIEAFVEVDNDINLVEHKHNVNKEDDSVAKDKLNFGLIEVVYEWGRKKVSYCKF